MENNWFRYLLYLNTWVTDHTDPKFEGMSPAGYDEWLDCEGEE